VTAMHDDRRSRERSGRLGTQAGVMSIPPEPRTPELEDTVTVPGDLGPSFDELYRASNARLIRLAWLLVGSRAVAEELVHDAFLDVYRRWDHIDNPGGYLHRAVVNGSQRWLRRRERERVLLGVAGEPPPTGDPAIDTMWDAIQRLRPERRAVVVLRYWADLPHEQIAEIVDCPIATVRTRLHRALADLRKETDR
jgi:RNA polymerase sigma-70 factor (sigma-E family)